MWFQPRDASTPLRVNSPKGVTLNPPHTSNSYTKCRFTSHAGIESAVATSFWTHHSSTYYLAQHLYDPAWKQMVQDCPWRQGPHNPVDSGELSALCKWNCASRESSTICLMETWLQKDKNPESAFQIDGYQLVRGDRTEAAGKRSGGGVCVYVIEHWCKNFRVFDRQCSDNIEYITLSLRPYYLPRELNKFRNESVYSTRW